MDESSHTFSSSAGRHTRDDAVDRSTYANDEPEEYDDPASSTETLAADPFLGAAHPPVGRQPHHLLGGRPPVNGVTAALRRATGLFDAYHRRRSFEEVSDPIAALRRDIGWYFAAFNFLMVAGFGAMLWRQMTGSLTVPLSVTAIDAFIFTASVTAVGLGIRLPFVEQRRSSWLHVIGVVVLTGMSLSLLASR